jgi:peptidoglycan hydrolase-like protein with peptidoglycan-binding domain
VTLVISTREHSRDPQPSPTVHDVQRALKARGYDLGSSSVDGVFGTMTERAIIRFQTHWGLTADGDVGPITWGKLSKPIPVPITTTSAEYMANVALARVTGADGAPRMRYVYAYEIALASSALGPHGEMRAFDDDGLGVHGG